MPNFGNARACPTMPHKFLWFPQVPDELFSQPEVQRLVVTNTVTEEYANIRLLLASNFTFDVSFPTSRRLLRSLSPLQGSTLLALLLLIHHTPIFLERLEGQVMRLKNEKQVVCRLMY